MTLNFYFSILQTCLYKLKGMFEELKQKQKKSLVSNSNWMNFKSHCKITSKYLKNKYSV